MQQQVSNGIQWLNSIEPGWKNLVNINKIDMANIEFCILGQIFGNYKIGCEKLVPGISRKDAYETIIFYGFTLSAEDHYVLKWRLLKEEWIKQIKRVA